MKKRNKPVIPGFGLSMGITISILSLVVLIPLASLVVYTAKLSFKDFYRNHHKGQSAGILLYQFCMCFCSSSNKWNYGNYSCVGACEI